MGGGTVDGGGRGRLGMIALTGAVAGLFSALFGVGGGIVMVPLLVAYLAYGVHAATATSLAAIVPIAVWGAATHGALGNVDWAAGVLLGVPAMAGVTIGVWAKARVGSAALTYAFAALLVVVAALLAAGV